MITMQNCRHFNSMRIIIVLGLLNAAVHGQSNYASHANNIEYQGEGLPEEATLDGKVKIV